MEIEYSDEEEPTSEHSRLADPELESVLDELESVVQSDNTDAERWDLIIFIYG